MKGLVSVFLFALTLAAAVTVPSDFVDTKWVGGLSKATAMDFAPDGRLFVCEQGGALRVIKDGKLLAEPFVKLKAYNAGERGLLGIAIDPNFVANQYVYVYYTAHTPAIHNRISRFTANGDVALLNSEVTILDLNNLSTAWSHNGGAIHFGPDGKLYAAVGENDRPTAAQTLNNLFGKILRINPDPSNLIPADNPFVTQASGVNRAIWALGLRNPFTFAIQPGTGRMFINDVGGTRWEEINDGVAGANFGWPETEGDHSDPRYARPIFAYGHGSGPTTGNAITGGAFYNPPTPQFPPEYIGRYFFADAVSRWVRMLNPANNAVTGFASGYLSPVDLKVGPDGALYVLARDAFGVHRVTYAKNQPPSITTHPSNQTVTVGQTATFSVEASGTAPLAYQWQRNGVNISGATQASYTTPPVTANNNGSLFRSVVTNPFGTTTSNPAALTVTSNQRPTGTITTPLVSRLYEGGQRINFAGTATDPEDGALPGSAFNWVVEFHHDDGSPHTHPVLGPQSGMTGFFDVPTSGEVSPNVFFRITLTVTDSTGLTHVSTREVQPRKVMLTLSAITLSGDPALSLKLDGQPLAEPHTFEAVVGMIRSIGAPSPQSILDKTYVFQGWSDGGAQQHDITVPNSNTAYTARYQRSTTPVSGLRFVPVTPCRIADTRNSNGPFGGPALGASSSRDFAIPSSACGIPASARAYSLNITAVPVGGLGFLSVWPTGLSQPSVSTLNSSDGRIKANAAIVPAGLNGAVTVFASDPTHAIVDVNGYFIAAGDAQGLAFYPVTPCRLVDTRLGTGALAGPALAAGVTRNFPVPAGPCAIPSNAQAYAMNFTAVPTGPLGFLSAWPQGSPEPGTSILNAPTGTVVSNLGIVRAGTNGGIAVVATNSTELIIDVTGYFAAPGAAGALDFYPATPCRILDTRGPVGPFGGPRIEGNETRSFAAPASTCGIPSTVRGFSLNATVVPPAGLGFLTLWGSGGMPVVSMLNSYDGSIVANAGLIRAGASGIVTAFMSDPSHLILDINGYFQ